MSAVDFPNGLVALLDDALGFPVVAGLVDGERGLELPNEWAGFGYVWPDEIAENDENVYHEQQACRVRLHLNVMQGLGSMHQPAGYEELYGLRDDLIAALRPGQSAQHGVWFYRLQSTLFRPAERYIEAVVVSYGQAAFTAAA